MILEPIIQYYIDKGELNERAAFDLRSFIEDLEGQTEYTTTRLKEVLQRFNHDTIDVDKDTDEEDVDGDYFEECLEGTCYPLLEIGHGMCDFNSDILLNYDGSVHSFDDEDPIVNMDTKPPSDRERLEYAKARSAIKIGADKYPVSLMGFYEYKFDQTTLYYTWLATIWQEIEGYRCGLRVSTFENNSCDQFSLNDFLNYDYSAYMEFEYGFVKPRRIGQFFPRKLTVTELFLRACLGKHSLSAYQNYWRYFEKEDKFVEMVTYDCTTGIRSGKLSERQIATIRQIEEHENLETALKYVITFTNQAIYKGWEEKFRPLGLPERIHQDAFEFGFKFAEDRENRPTLEDVQNFEGRHKLQLPNVFAQYLRLFNGQKYDKRYSYFPIDDLYTVKMAKFYTLEEMDQLTSETLHKHPDILWFGRSEEESLLGICIQKDKGHYGKVAIKEKDSIRICDYSFEKFARYAQDQPMQPEIFSAQTNDIAFLRKRIAEGWDFNTNYHYLDALGQAAEYNAHEALELLLQNGARPHNRYHREKPWEYDEKTMDLLDQYP